MLKNFSMFAGLPDGYLTRLEEISNEIFVSKGSILFSPGDSTRGFYAVIDGAVRIYRVSPKGKELNLEIASAGNIFAEASLFSDAYHCYAEVIRDSHLYQIRKDAFLGMIQSDIAFATTWINILSIEVIHLRQRLEELFLKSSRARIASYILLLAEIQNTTYVILPVHRKSIATLLGMTHETFYRTAKDLERESLVRFDGQSIEILNRSLLEDMVD